MTIERINELKSKYERDVIYYGNLDFLVLQSKFQEVVNLLNEIEEIIKINAEMSARLSAVEAEVPTEEVVSDNRAEVTNENI